MQHAMVGYYIIICSVCGCTIFFRCLIKGTIFGKKVTEREIQCYDFLYNVCLKYYSFGEELSEILSQNYLGLHVRYSLFLSDFNHV